MGDDDDDHRNSINQKIMVAMFLCSFFFVLLLIMLHLYSRYLIRGRQRERHAIFLFGLGRQTRPDVESSIEPPKRGLDRLVIALLPTFTYKPADQSSSGHGEPAECSICLGNVVEGDMVRVLPNCKHLFHVECIDMWLGSNSTCPICRTDAEPRVQPGEKDDMESTSTGVQPSAPPLEGNNMAAHGTAAHIAKEGGSGTSRLTSFRGMLNREWSLRTRSCRDEIRAEDIEER